MSKNFWPLIVILTYFVQLAIEILCSSMSPILHGLLPYFVQLCHGNSVQLFVNPILHGSINPIYSVQICEPYSVQLYEPNSARFY